MVHGLFCSLLFSRRFMLFLLCTPSPECEGCPRSLYRSSWHRDWIFLIWFFSGFRWWLRVIHDFEGEKMIACKWCTDCGSLLHYFNVNYCQLLIAVDMMRRWKRPGALQRQIPAYGVCTGPGACTEDRRVPMIKKVPGFQWFQDLVADGEIFKKFIEGCQKIHKDGMGWWDSHPAGHSKIPQHSRWISSHSWETLWMDAIKISPEAWTGVGSEMQLVDDWRCICHLPTWGDDQNQTSLMFLDILEMGWNHQSCSHANC